MTGEDIALIGIIICIGLVFITLIYAGIRNSNEKCSICGFQPNSGYYWINNQRYCNDCFKKIRECKLTEQGTQYKILMRIQEERQKLIEETKLLTVDTEWDWLKKK
jgi:hypothetical protein